MKTETSTPTPGSTTGSTTHSTTHSTAHSTKHSSTSPKPDPDPKNVVLITGGSNYNNNNATRHSAEIFLPNSPSTPCILPDLPAPYYAHTQDTIQNRALLCGGVYTSTRDNCRQWSYKEGKFPAELVHKFSPDRYHHVSWTPASERETFLIGGGSLKTGATASTSSTLVKPGVFYGTPGFNLTQSLFGACSIPDPDSDTVVITGGNYFYKFSDSYKVTSLYNEDGFIENFGNLNYKRYFHGCTSYIADKKRV